MDEVTPQDVEVLARVARLPLPAERLAATAAVLEASLEVIRSFDALDLRDVEPSSTFSAAWD